MTPDDLPTQEEKPEQTPETEPANEESAEESTTSAIPPENEIGEETLMDPGEESSPEPSSELAAESVESAELVAEDLQAEGSEESSSTEEPEVQEQEASSETEEQEDELSDPVAETEGEQEAEEQETEEPHEEAPREVSEDDPEAAQTEEEPEEATNLAWYVVKVQSGREESIKDAIERRVIIDGLEDHFGQVYIPYEEVVEMRRGKRVTRRGKKLPGYIMAQVEYNDEILYLFRETSGVGDFVGGNLDRPPQPMTPAEIKQWMGKDAPGTTEDEPGVKETPREDIPYSVGDQVKVKTGMFNGMEGEIQNIDYEKGTIHVVVSIFGRPVDAELEHWNVEPASE